MNPCCGAWRQGIDEMPEELERKLKAEALKKFGSTTSERARAYIYGAMRKTGWNPYRENKGKK
jgi:hypothetical protein